MYSGIIRAGVYLSVVILVVGDRYLSLVIVLMLVLGFVFWLFVYAKDNGVAERVEKGRQYSKNPIKMGILYLITMVAFGLQPQQYEFAFALHF